MSWIRRFPYYWCNDSKVYVVWDQKWSLAWRVQIERFLCNIHTLCIVYNVHDVHIYVCTCLKQWRRCLKQCYFFTLHLCGFLLAIFTLEWQWFAFSSLILAFSTSHCCWSSSLQSCFVHVIFVHVYMHTYICIHACIHAIHTYMHTCTAYSFCSFHTYMHTEVIGRCA